MKHNKRRNTGLLYEFLARHAAEGIVDGDEKCAKLSIKLLRKHFKEGSELQREFRLFRALIGSYVADRETAERIVDSARNAARSYDSKKLDHEKSLLIRNINHTFNDEGFYDKRIDEYRLFATVQTLLNEWRQEVPSDIVRIAVYEADLIEHLLQPKQNNVLDEAIDDRADDLTVSLMAKKISNKHKDVMNEEQTALLNAYVYSLKSNDTGAFLSMLQKLRSETLAVIDEYVARGDEDEELLQRLSELKKMINVDITEAVDDAVMAKHLRIAALKRELLEG
jgi:hypothetical protein